MAGSPSSTRTALKAGLLYFVGVFALGFALGGIRLIFLVPALGEFLAVLIEVPVILGLSWLLCARAIHKLQLAAEPRARLLMGAVAFVLLMLAEFLLARFMFGESTAVYLAGFGTAAGLLGLAGQIVFALFPLLQLFFQENES
jgi:hypothetical protein